MSRALTIGSTPWGEMPIWWPLVPVSKVAPAYPAELKAAGKKAQVTLDALIDIAGIPIDVRVLKSSGDDAFDKGAVICLRRWRFPVMREDRGWTKGPACRVVVLQTIIFDPNDQEYRPRNPPDLAATMDMIATLRRQSEAAMAADRSRSI